ncbi:MAG: hypothetical protein RIC24_00685 [Hyphomicrobiales bacterium]|jgi:hypothetical protein
MTSALGLGVLSWKAPETLAVTLQSHRDGGLPDLFDEQLVLLQESDETSRGVVDRFGYHAHNIDDNKGILGGFDALAATMASEVILITENDFPLVEQSEVVSAQIKRAFELIEEDEADIVLLRSRDKPGSPFDIGDKYPRYFPGTDATLRAQLAGLARRTLRPGKARRLRARSTCIAHDAPKIAPFAIADLGAGFHLTNSQFLPWTNNPFMVRRSFFIDTLLAFAKAAPTKRRVNGFKNLEIELNCEWWRKSQFRIVHAPGLFTHGRVGDRGY